MFCESVPRKDEVGGKETETTGHSHVVPDGEGADDACPRGQHQEQSIDGAADADGQFPDSRYYFQRGKDERRQTE